MRDELHQLISRLNDPDLKTRLSALDEIGTVKPLGALDLLIKSLSDPEAQIRVEAACNLGDLDDPEAIPHLVRASSEDPSEDVRGEALAALSNYHNLEVLKRLVSEVYRPKLSRRPRQEVAKQLGRYDANEAVDALVRLLEDEDVFVREYAAESLFRLNRPRLADVWRHAAKDRSEDVREVATKALQSLCEEGRDP